MGVDICPECEKGLLHPVIGSETLNWHGKNITVRDLRYARCDCCGAEVAHADTAQHNDRQYSLAKDRGFHKLTLVSIYAACLLAGALISLLIQSWTGS